jgi:FKBP-type peptidyl-prolyl cis-trans isomerase FkpA
MLVPAVSYKKGLLYLTIVLLLSAATMGCSAYAQDQRSIAAQKTADDKKLQEYFAKNNIQPQKSGGLYYTIAEEGAGKKILAGETVTLNYTGRLLDGTVFDSNIDPAFHHTEPLVVEIGTGKVIMGWDKGVQLLKKGAKATLYIPSGLAYGPDGGPVAPNSILVFDVTVTEVTK